MDKRLYDIAKEYEDILSIIEDSEGEITPEVEEKLSINENELEDKLRAYKDIISKYKYENEYIKDEQERLKDRIKNREYSIKYLKNNVVKTLTLYGEKGVNNFKLKYPDFTVYTKDTTSIDFNINKVETLINRLNIKPDDDEFYIEECIFDYEELDIMNDCVTIKATVEIPIGIINDFNKLCTDKTIAITNTEYKLNRDYIKKLFEAKSACEKTIKENTDVGIVSRAKYYHKLYDKIIDELGITVNHSTTVIFK